MNWIGKWCASMCDKNKSCDSCSERCIPREQIAAAVKCSEHLVWMLMFQRDVKIQPLIANNIADYIGATVEERDSIVHPKHHGTWKPDPNRKNMYLNRARRRSDIQPVVAIDRLGYIVKRFMSKRDAAKYVGCTGVTVANRCNGVLLDKDEFSPYGLSFRYESEWDRLTQEERLANIKRRSAN